MGLKLAIDFGTTNSVIARWDEATQQAQTVALPPLSLTTSAGVSLIPTLVYVQDGQTRDCRIGQTVRAAGWEARPGNRLFRNFKRTLGGESLLEARLIDGAPWTEAQAAQTFLHQLLTALPEALEELEQLVITVPVAALENYTAWLQHALPHLAEEKIRLVDESTAAALGYAVSEPGALVLVIDLGGGTADFSLVRLPPHLHANAQVIAKAGLALGGSDVDQWLLSAVLQRAQLTPADLGTHYAAWLATCEQAKIALSTETETTLNLSTPDGRAHAIPFTRAELEALLTQQGFFTALQHALEKVMGFAARAGIYREDIQHVLLVGGTALIPSVQQTLDAHFRAVTQRQRKAISQMPTWPATTWNVANTSIRVDKPFTAVVEGALQVAAGFGLRDQLAHGYGVRLLDATGLHQYDEIIPQGSVYPMAESVRLVLGASRPQQTQVELVIAQINTEAVATTQVLFDQEQSARVAHPEAPTRPIVPINAHAPLLVPLNPPGQPGQARLQAEFRVDALRRLRVSVTDLQTHQTLLHEAVVATLVTGMASEDGHGISGSEPVCIPPEVLGFWQRLSRRFVPQHRAETAEADALRSPDVIARYAAAEKIARRGDREARLKFEALLQTGEPHQRASAVAHLHHFSWFTAEPLFQQALRDDEARVREAALLSLGKMRLPQAYALAAQILPTATDGMRRAAVWGMQSHPDPAAVPALAATLIAHDPEIRSLALEVLGATEAEAAVSVVKSALNDAHPEVQYAATLSWVELERERCLDELAQWIVQTRGWSRRWILRGFFHATNYMNVNLTTSLVLLSALEVALGDELPEARLAAFFPLAWMRHAPAEALLQTAFRREPDSDTRARMLTAAVHLMSPAAATLLADAQHQEDQVLKQTAEFLLKQPNSNLH